MLPNIQHLTSTPIFKRLNDSLLSPEIRATHFKVVHQVLPVNVRMHRFHITNNALCPLCKSHPESLQHLFYQCIVTAPLWILIGDIFFNMCNHRLKPNFMLVVFGDIHEDIPSSVKPLALLITAMLKHCIWVKRCEIVFQRRTFDTENFKLFFIAFLKYRSSGRQSTFVR